MTMLEKMGLESIGDQDGIVESIEYCAKDDGVPVNGNQYIGKGKAGDAANENSSFCQGIGSLFKLDAALPAHVCGVEDNSCLVEFWRNRSDSLDRSSFGDTIDIFWPTFSSNIEPITAALVYTSMISLTMRFGGSGISGSGVAMANAGYFFSTMFCGRPLCTREELIDDFSTLQHEPVFQNLCLEFNSSSELAGCCAALLEIQHVDELKFSMNRLEWADKWKWLAYALFCRESNCVVQKLIISGITLAEADVDDVEAVMKSNYPLPILDRGSSNLAQPPQYGYVHLVKGTKLRPVTMDITDDIAVVLSENFKARAMFDPPNSVYTVVPGVGVCEKSVGDGINDFMSDSTSDSEILAVSVHRISSLELDLEAIEDNSLIAKLLNSIGKRLQHLSLRYAGEIHQNIDLGDIATVCPALESLFLRDFNVSITSNELLRAWGIKSLIIEGSNEIAGLPDCLSDHTFRMSRELTELRILPPPTRFQSSWMRNLSVSAEFVAALQEHDGDILSITKHKLPVSSKLALISVAEVRSDQNLSVEASYSMDFHVLTSIFAFAATPQHRIVEAIPYGGLPRPRLRQY
ncbi:hypothetical protein PHMEG_00022831 [Phytophthora megakarya]|uniref:Uncharacterized protein n=1 Tax=Phytophthora megakarya TaxID=4795 RepID=A0A225VHP4_9STRA|nr:hypothetical protein PHMEG_00022831 [Phytophthora megakarya]